jgi:hypothetical protein
LDGKARMPSAVSDAQAGRYKIQVSHFYGTVPISRFATVERRKCGARGVNIATPRA